MAKQVDLNEWVADVIATEGDKRYVKKESGKGLSTNDYTTTEKNKLSGIEAQANKTNVDSSLSTNSENPVQNKVINAALITKVDKETGKGLFSGSYNDLTNKPNIPTNTNQLTNGAGFLTRADIEGLGGNVTVEQQASPDSGYTATYVIKQDGTQVGTKINIPKDFLVRRATVETSIANNSPQAGFIKGDKYLDFVVNTKDNSGVDEHLYINVNDLFNEYEADEVTLTLSADNVFSIKNGAIPQANTTASNIKMNGAQSAGTANTWAKADHVHPVDTSRAASSHTHTKTEITDFPTSMTPTSHVHGSITNNGTLNTDTNNVNKVVVTDSNQNIRTISKIPYAKIDNTPTIPSKVSELTNDKGYVTSDEVGDNIDLTGYVKTNDTRLSDAREPTFHTHVKSDISDFPTLAIVATSGSYNDLSNKPTIPDISGKAPNNHASTANTYGLGSTSNYGHVKTINGLTQSSHTDGTALSAYQGKVLNNKFSNYLTTSNASSTYLTKTDASNTYQPKGNYLTSHNPIDTALDSTSTNAVQNKVINTALNGKTVTLTKLTGSNITSGYLSTYEIKQGTTSLGKIDIPKDYLVKSGSVKTVTTANSPVNGYAVGDKYIDFIVNTKDSSGTDEHIYINVKDLIDTYEPATQSANGLMSSTDKTKLDGIATGANAYTHPNDLNATKTSGLYKVALNTKGHVTSATAVEKSDITGLGIPGSDTTYSNATTSSAGLMSSDDKTKLNGIATNANAYTHPTPSNLGGAKTTAVFKKITYDANGHITGTTNVEDSDLPNHTHDDQYYTKTDIQNNYIAKEDLEDMVGLSYDDSTGILTITFDTN